MLRLSLRWLCEYLDTDLPGAEVAQRLTMAGVETELAVSAEQRLRLRFGEEELLEFTPTPDRGDCLSALGAARELAAILDTPWREPPVTRVAARASEEQTVILEDTSGCPRYAGRVLLDLEPEAKVPDWLSERLHHSELGSLHPVVDISNYVMLELGQPLHTFDRAKLHGAVRVRRAARGERLELLDGITVRLDPEHLVIADERRVLALAGVMGGRESAVGPETREVFLESAWFHPERIAHNMRAVGLRTAAAQRFERGVDPGLPERALERATELLVQYCGARPGPLVLEEAPGQLPQRASVLLRRGRLKALLGWEPPPERVRKVFRRQGMPVEDAGEDWHVTVPGHRPDLKLEVDLVGEVARLLGYEHIPSVKPRPSPARHVLPVLEDTAWHLAQLLCARGYHEAMSYSFVDPELQKRLFPDQEAPLLAHPLASSMSVLRLSTWCGLLSALRHNLRRQQERVRLFEYGVVFSAKHDGRPGEEFRLGGVACGTAHDEQWGEDSRPLDFYDLKGDLERLLEGAGKTRFEAVTHPALHDGQAARVTLETGDGVQQQLGLLGRLHPALAADLKLPSGAWLFELRLNLLEERPPVLKPLSRFPSLRRDLALVVAEEMPAAAVLESIRAAAGEDLAELRLFDVYHGQELGKNLKSLAIGLIFQKESSTLGQEELERKLSEILAAVRGKCGAVLRESG